MTEVKPKLREGLAWKYIPSGSVTHIVADHAARTHCGIEAWYSSWLDDSEGLDERRACKSCSTKIGL